MEIKLQGLELNHNWRIWSINPLIQFLQHCFRDGKIFCSSFFALKIVPKFGTIFWFFSRFSSCDHTIFKSVCSILSLCCWLGQKNIIFCMTQKYLTHLQSNWCSYHCETSSGALFLHWLWDFIFVLKRSPSECSPFQFFTPIFFVSKLKTFFFYGN